jgi:hypothetical protein
MNSNILAVPALAVLILASCSESPVASVKKSLVNPPIPSLDPKYEKFVLDAGKDTSIIVPNTLGTVITYKANTLMDTLNRPVKGRVIFKYREFHDAYKTVLAGIPMTYDNNGKQENFETAGMFELSASQYARPVAIRKGNSIGVKFGGKTPGNDYPFYYLDEQKGWSRLDLDSAEVNQEKVEARMKLEKKKKQLSPIPFDDDHFVFNYDAALDVYYKDNRQQIYANRNSSSVKHKIKKYGLKWIPAYDWEAIKFKGAEYPAMMMVWKNLSGGKLPSMGEYAEAKLTPLGNNIYQVTLQNQKGKKAVIKAEVVMPLRSLFAFTAEQWKTKYDENMKLVHMEEERMAKMAEVFRYYEVNNFGTYNYDKFMKQGEIVMVDAEFKFDTAKPDLGDTKIYCVLNEGRGVMTWEPEMWKNFYFLKRNDMKMFTLLAPNKLVVFPSEKIDSVFNEIKAKKLKEYEFGMVTTKELKDPSDLEMALK